MAVSERLKRVLDGAKAQYEIVPHREVFTAQEVAQSAHVAGRKVAKVVVVRDHAGADVMVVLPANQHLDPVTLEHVSGRPGLQLESEPELRRLFPDCELGAMPPFGRLYDLSTYVDPCLKGQDEIFFQAGNHHELVRMRFESYAKLSGAFISAVCLHKELARAG